MDRTLRAPCGELLRTVRWAVLTLAAIPWPSLPRPCLRARAPYEPKGRCRSGRPHRSAGVAGTLQSPGVAIGTREWIESEACVHRNSWLMFERYGVEHIRPGHRVLEVGPDV